MRKIMQPFIGIGKALVSLDEIREKGKEGVLYDFTRKAELNLPVSLPCTTGTISGRDIVPRAGFAPIGIGKPLSVNIQHIYVGKLTSFLDSFFSLAGSPDILLTSSVKNDITLGSAPKAINLLRSKVKDFANVPILRASEIGCPLVYYSPAVVDSTICITLEFIDDSFSEKTFKQMGDLLGKASGLPIFAPASAYLLAGSILIKIIGEIGEALTDGKAFMIGDFPIRFDTPGISILQSGKILFMDNNDRDELLSQTEWQTDGYARISKQTGKPYKGNAPYISASLDGKERDDYKTFTPKLASTAILSRFFHSDQSSPVIDAVGKALDLYNNFDFHQKALREKGKMDSCADNQSEEYKKAETLYKAFLSNITNDLFKAAI